MYIETTNYAEVLIVIHR